MSSDLDNDYEVNLKTNKEIFDYNSVNKLPILLKGHIELPQEYKFTSPKLSKEGKYLTAIGKSKKEKEPDIVYIWNTKYLNKKSVLKVKGISKIEIVEFSPDENVFVIVYKDEPPVFFDFNKGEELSKCQDKKPKHTEIFSYAFSNKGKNFAIATDKDFVAYNIKTGKIKRQIISDAPIKVFRGKKAAFIDNYFNVNIIDIKIGKTIKTFQLTAMEKIGGIFSTMMSPDNNYIYYMKKEGIYKISIEDEEIVQIKIEQDEDNNIKDGLISEDCKMCMTTDKIKAKFWDLENAKSIGDLFKEEFDSFSVNFPQSKLITSDDICIDLTDIMNDKAEQKYIWLDLNPEKFMSFSFSPDYKVILAKIDEFTAISYNCIKGEVIKKWKINIPNWYRACEMVPETSNIGVIATKSYNKIIKIWDYLTGTDLSTFIGFDVNNFSFSKYGNYLGAGTVEGEEIARVWDLTNGNEFHYFHKEYKNKNTFVNISKSEPYKVIAVAEEQNPVIYDLIEQQFILECTGCPIQLSTLSNIKSNEGNKLFFIYGEDINNILTAIVFDFHGNMINEYNNCRKIEFGKADKYLLTDSDNINKGNLTISHIDEHYNMSEINLDFSGVGSKFLDDNKTIATIVDNEENKNKKTILINNIETGDSIAEIEFIKKTEKYSEIYISADTNDNNVIFRFIELRNPERK